MEDLRRKHPSRKGIGIILLSGFFICACNALSARSSNARTGHADIVRDQLGYLPTNFSFRLSLEIQLRGTSCY
jgi:hypothetical protein